MIILHGRQFLSLAFKWLFPISSFLTQSWRLLLQLPNARAIIRQTHYQSCHREGAFAIHPAVKSCLHQRNHNCQKRLRSWKPSFQSEGRFVPRLHSANLDVPTVRATVHPLTNEVHRSSIEKHPRMDGYFLNRRRPLLGTDNTPTPSMNLPSGQARPSNFHGVPRHQPQDSANRLHSTVLSDQWGLPQTRSGRVRQPANATVDDNPFGSSDLDDFGVEKPRKSRRVLGVDLEDRKRQAEDRIRRGGWKAEIVEMAIEFAQDHSWNDTDANNSPVRLFMRNVENLGELCDDMTAIRGFLDMNIHKFIAFHAMEKDFKVLGYFVYKANQRRGDRVLKYRWFRSFIREYQGWPRETEESLVQDYKEQVDEPHASIGADQPGRANGDGTIHVSIPTAPATTATDASLVHGVNDPSIERRRVRLDNKGHRRKRQRTFVDLDDLEEDDLMTNIKTEPTEDDSIWVQDEDNEADTGGAGMQGLADMGEADDGEEIIHTKRRTLKVLLYGMRDDGAEESDHVQVYVPRTSKGVTINFI